MRGDRAKSDTWVRRRGKLRGAAHGVTLTLTLALTLAVLSGALLSSQIVSAAARTSFSGASANDLLVTSNASSNTSTPGATGSVTPPTDTPTATSDPTAPPPTDTPTATATSGPTATPTPPPNPYALDISAAITEAGWPQQGSNWCGIATVAAIADYIAPQAQVSQQGVTYTLNDPNNASEWSYPTKSGWGPYVPTDIARDFGTDPRSLAEGLTLATGIQYHVIVDTHGAWDTTIHIVDDLLTTRKPISVFVDNGQHSVVVSGVDATGNPLTNPGSITAIHVWDPGGGVNGIGIQPHMEQAVPIKTWLSGIISWSGSNYFKYPYAANNYQGVPLDPDPAVGPYAYQPSKYNHMWIGSYVYLSTVAQAATASLNADWELTPYGALYVGYATSGYPATPTGYTGPTVPMPTNTPPPPPPVRPPKPRPPLPPAPKPKPAPTATPKPTPTLRPRPTPSTYFTTDTAPIDTPTPNPVCAPVNCALAAIAAIAVSPGPLVIALLLLVLLGLSLIAPLLLPALFAHRTRGTASDARTVDDLQPPAAASVTDDQASASADGEGSTSSDGESDAPSSDGGDAASSDAESDATVTNAESDAASSDAESDAASSDAESDAPTTDNTPQD